MSFSVLSDPGMIVVLVMRVIGPLIIFPFPLFGSLLSEFVLDASDVMIWDRLGSLDLIDYTAWDKMLDMWQLTIQAVVAYQWPRGTPKTVALSLFGYRLTGFILYELTRFRIFFLLFPNVFVLFFIAYLACRKAGKERWFEQKRSVAFILALLFILKLPQEFILHYREIPMWEVIKNGLGI